MGTPPVKTRSEYSVPESSARVQSYEPPQITVIGSLHELTQTRCVFNKTIGPPDFFNFIPIANCSA